MVIVPSIIVILLMIKVIIIVVMMSRRLKANNVQNIFYSERTEIHSKVFTFSTIIHS